MKKVLLMVALAFTTLTISAQEDSKWTMKAGFGMSSIVGSDVDDVKSVLAYKVGVAYGLELSENFSILPGLEFAVKGFKSDWIDGNIKMAYLQIPIHAAYSFSISDNMDLSVKAGPYLAYGIFGSDIEWYGGGKTNIFDSDGGFNRFDAGVNLGASVDFGIFTAGIEYSHGLTKLDSDYKQYNQAFGVVVGYKF